MELSMELNIPPALEFFGKLEQELTQEIQARTEIKMNNFLRQAKISMVKKNTSARIVFDMQDPIDKRTFEVMKTELASKGYEISFDTQDFEGWIEVTLP